METTQDKSQAQEEGEKGDSTSPMRQNMRSHNGCTRNTTPPIEWASKASPRNDRKMGHITVTDEPSTSNLSTKSHIARMRLGQTVFRPLRLGIDK